METAQKHQVFMSNDISFKSSCLFASMLLNPRALFPFKSLMMQNVLRDQMYKIASSGLFLSLPPICTFCHWSHSRFCSGENFGVEPELDVDWFHQYRYRLITITWRHFGLSLEHIWLKCIRLFIFIYVNKVNMHFFVPPVFKLRAFTFTSPRFLHSALVSSCFCQRKQLLSASLTPTS